MRRWRGSGAWAWGGLGVLLLAAGSAARPSAVRAGGVGPAGPATATAPVTTRAAFAPGVAIDWSRREVRVQSHVVLRRGPLEFLACFGGKEHESILRLDATAVPIYMALGLVGLEPGCPPGVDAETEAPTAPRGALLEVTLCWQAGGRPQEADAWSWLRRRSGAGTPVPRPWVFSGSLRRGDGTLEADRSGVGFALVDFPDSLVCLSRGRSSSDATLWCEAYTAVIPPVNTPVEVVLRPARARVHEVRLWAGARLEADGWVASAEDVADLVLLERRLRPDYIQVITAPDVRPVERALLAVRLRRAGLPTAAVRISAAAPRPTMNPD
jgi:hypothetical protein